MLPALLVLLSVSPIDAQVTFTDINPDNSNLDARDPDGATGGRVNGLAVVADDNQTLYAASEWGGLYQTTDQGLNWSRLDGHLPVVTWDVEVDPLNSNIVYATSFFDGRAVDSLSGINVSNDGGITWDHPATATPPSTYDCSAARKSERAAFGIAIDPATPENVYVGTNCGVAFSNDSGATWSFVDPTPADSASDVWDVVVHNGGIIDTCGDDGHARSTDGGTTWTLGSGLASGTCSIAVSPDESYVLFAVVGTRIYQTNDGGATWLNNITNPRRQGRIPFVATNQRTGSGFDLWFGDVQLHRWNCTTPATPASGGANRCPSAPAAGPFTRGAGGHDDMGDIAFDSAAANDACPVVMSSDGGVYYNTTSSSPACHSPAWEQPAVTPHGLWLFTMSGADQTLDASEDLYFGNQDNGVFGTTDGRALAPAWNNDQCCDGFDTAADSDQVLYTVCCFSGFPPTRLHRRGPGMAGGTGRLPLSSAPPGSLPGFRFPDILDNWAPDSFVAISSVGLFMTTAASVDPIAWTELGPATEPATGRTGMCAVRAAVNAGVPTFYVQVGNCDTLSGDQLWKFEGTDPTAAWQQVALPTGGISIFGVDRSDPDRLGAANLSASGPQMIFSSDGGATWTTDTDLTNLMSGNGSFKAQTLRGATNFTSFNGYPQPSLVAFDPEDADILVAGGRDSGVFLSVNGGSDWSLVTDPFDPVASGVPHLPRPHFAHFDHEPDGDVSVYLGTQGRGVWRMSLDLNEAPIATDNSYTTLEDTQLAGNVITDDSGDGADSDPDGDSLRAVKDSDPTNGTLALSTNGSFTYDPDLNYCGPDSFTYHVNDGPTPSSGLPLDSNTATVSIDVTCVNDPPVVAIVSPGSQTIDYSDAIARVTITATDVDNVTLTLSQVGAPSGLPDPALASTKSCSEVPNASVMDGVTCTWTLDGQVLAPGDNVNNIDFTASDGLASSSSNPPTTRHVLTVEPEDAAVLLASTNPVSEQVATEGGNSGTFSLFFSAQEINSPDNAHGGSALPGNLNQMAPLMTLVPVGPGGPVAVVCNFVAPLPNPADGYAQIANFECVFDDVPPNTYSVVADVGGSVSTQRYYNGTDEGVFVVYDPSLGFITGGGWFYWPGTSEADYPGDKTNFGFNVKYNKRGKNVQGNLLLMRHTADGETYRVKSNALDGMATGTGPDVLNRDYGWAVFSGKSTFREPGMDTVGNHPFQVYVEDHGEQGCSQDPVDQFWIEVQDKDGAVVLQLNGANPAGADTTVDGDDEPIECGNVVVPHESRGKGKP